LALLFMYFPFVSVYAPFGPCPTHTCLTLDFEESLSCYLLGMGPNTLVANTVFGANYLEGAGFNIGCEPVVPGGY